MRATCLSIAAATLLALAHPAAADEVFVTNLPAVQAVSGKVSVDGPVAVQGRTDSTSFVAFEDRLVPPLGPAAMPRELVNLGFIEAKGYASVVASVAAWVPGGSREAGVIGLLLVPDVAIVRESVDRDGSAPFAIRVETSIAHAAGTTVFASSPRQLLAFPRWRAYLYNTSGTALRAHAFVMMGD